MSNWKGQKTPKFCTTVSKVIGEGWLKEETRRRKRKGGREGVNKLFVKHSLKSSIVVKRRVIFRNTTSDYSGPFIV